MLNVENPQFPSWLWHSGHLGGCHGSRVELKGTEAGSWVTDPLRDTDEEDLPTDQHEPPGGQEAQGQVWLGECLNGPILLIFEHSKTCDLICTPVW